MFSDLGESLSGSCQPKAERAKDTNVTFRLDTCKCCLWRREGDNKLNTSLWDLGTQNFDSVQLKLTEYLLFDTIPDAIKNNASQRKEQFKSAE